MRKLFLVFLICLILSILSACGKEEKSNYDPSLWFQQNPKPCKTDQPYVSSWICTPE